MLTVPPSAKVENQPKLSDSGAETSNADGKTGVADGRHRQQSAPILWSLHQFRSRTRQRWACPSGEYRPRATASEHCISRSG